ncbi:MAG: cation transporting ATPase C-terminal domain-containing protein, partial [archaeon]
LKDNNFATIVTAIKEGRTIFSNIRKFITYDLSCTFAELFIIIFAVIFGSKLGWPIPILLPLQILFMNMVVDNFSSIALGFNPSSNDIMLEKPKMRDILNKNLIYLFLFAGILTAGFTLAVYFFIFNVLGMSSAYAITTTVLTLILLQIFGSFVFRSFRKGVFNRSLVTNKYLFYASLISIVATIVIIYTPLNNIFGMISLSIIQWIIAVGVGILFILIFDVLKLVNNKFKFWSV